MQIETAIILFKALKQDTQIFPYQVAGGQVYSFPKEKSYLIVFRYIWNRHGHLLCHILKTVMPIALMTVFTSGEEMEQSNFPFAVRSERIQCNNPHTWDVVLTFISQNNPQFLRIFMDLPIPMTILLLLHCPPNIRMK